MVVSRRCRTPRYHIGRANETIRKPARAAPTRQGPQEMPERDHVHAPLHLYDPSFPAAGLTVIRTMVTERWTDITVGERTVTPR
ncbi:hypothetical protein GCM10022224_045360 [Nonomuraea antimicrobica]|uniref:Uncharacterized protein n=1 Tax=Nonomuraea antimicrobica TaxID=561173 RepID=A0ABP7C0V5_9ACTN